MHWCTRMELTNQPCCVICGSAQQLWRCAKCKSVYYCSPGHQHIDWPSHKQSCRLLARQKNNNNNRKVCPPTEQQPAATRCGLRVPAASPPVNQQVYGTHEREILNTTAESVATNSNYGNFHGNVDANSTTMEQIQFMAGSQPPAPASPTAPLQQVQPMTHHLQPQPAPLPPPPTQPAAQTPYNGQSEKSVSCQIGRCDANLIGDVNERRYEDLCRNIINDMNEYGLSVVDDFLGMNKGLHVLNEVHRMYAAGVFKDGQLVNNPQQEQNKHRIRGDKITWVKGVEQGCSNVGYLINQIDAVICRANTMLDNGKLGKYNIKERTKAMVACYPGSGSHYVMHVDNPNKDGRVITAIYYLNVNWDTRRSGGVLRIFPEHGNSVADIEPKFDRLIFFWSDKRNPHEVQPAHRTRYAITVWYFDADEREKALNQWRDEQSAQRSTAASGQRLSAASAAERNLQYDDVTNSGIAASPATATASPVATPKPTTTQENT